jgi:starch synthase (maltosyl-transferring)
LEALQLDPADFNEDGRFLVDDLISGQSWWWGEHNYVRLDAHVEPAHILSIRRQP